MVAGIDVRFLHSGGEFEVGHPNVLQKRDAQRAAVLRLVLAGTSAVEHMIAGRARFDDLPDRVGTLRVGRLPPRYAVFKVFFKYEWQVAGGLSEYVGDENSKYGRRYQSEFTPHNTATSARCRCNGTTFAVARSS